MSARRYGITSLIPPQEEDTTDAVQWLAGYNARAAARGGITADALMRKHFSPPRYAVEGVLTPGANLLVAKPKKGKSLMGLDMGLSITMDTPALGSIPVTQGSVIILALEDNNRRLQKRIRRMIDGPAPSNLYLFTEWKRFNEGGLEDLEEKIKLIPDLRFVVVDTLAKVRPPIKSNIDRYAQDYACITQIKALADKYDICILVVHHLRKEASEDIFDCISGSNGLTAAADGILVLESAKGINTLHVTGRDIDSSELAIELDKQTLRWRILGPRAEVQDTHNQRAVYAALRNAREALTPTEIAENSSCKRETVKKVLARFLSNGTVQRTNYGRYILSETAE